MALYELTKLSDEMVKGALCRVLRSLATMTATQRASSLANLGLQHVGFIVPGADVRERA
jgi:hypothetical protein